MITLFQNEDGLPTVEDLRKVVGPRTAGLLITNPEDTGIFNPRIAEFVQLVHEAGGLCGYDQANVNGIMGITRAKEAGFDMCFFNLHKTFGTPHGCGGPAGGALGVTSALKDFLPVPLVEFDGHRYWMILPVLRRAQDHRQDPGLPRHGAGGPESLRLDPGARARKDLREVSEVAVLNNNYLLEKISEAPRRLRPLRGRAAAASSRCATAGSGCTGRRG